MKKKKILIADDSELVRNFLQTVLEAEGYEVDTAVNGVEGIMRVFEWHPDLIILDVEMPVMKGYQAGRFLKSNPGTASLPVIIHTTKDDDVDRFWGMSTGADAFITKNFDQIKSLLDTVESLIASSSPDGASPVITRKEGLFTEQDVLTAVNELLDTELFFAAVMTELGRISNTISSPAETIERVFGMFNRIIGFDIAGFYIDRKEEALFLTYENTPVKGIADAFFESVKPQLKNFVEDVSLKKIRVNRIKKSVNPQEGDVPKIRTMWIRPVRSLSMQTGVLVFASLKKNGFTPDRIKIISRIYSQAAMLIHNAVLFNEIKQLEEKTRRIFEMYVPPEVIKNFLGSGDEALLSGEKRKVAILFSDIRSFTSISEKMPAEKVVSMLNSYFSRMVAGITSSRGTIDKFIGDAILAIFGAPRQTPNNSYYAVLAALEMHARLVELNRDNEKIGIPELRIGIGIHFGDAIVGNIGSAEKMDYTVIGDSVNLASRLEGLTKYYGVGIIVSEDVARAIDEYAEKILVIEIDAVRVKGKKKPTVIFTVFDRADISESHYESISAFQKGYSLYRLGNFDEAIKIFETMTDDLPVKDLYVTRCARYSESPPAVWDGVYDMQSK